MTALNFLIIAPVLAGLVVWLLARWPKVAAGIGAMVTAGVALLLWTMAVPDTAVSTPPTTFLSQELIFSTELRGILLFIYAGLTILFLLTIAFPQSRTFVPGSLGVMSLLTAGLLIRPFSVGLILIWIGLAITAVIIQEKRANITHGGLLYLLLFSVAMPLFLLAVWLVETQSVNLVTPVARFGLLGMIILLAGFPFHIWVTAVVRESQPLVQALVFGLIQLVVVAFIFAFLAEVPWLQADVQFQEMVRLSGIGMLLTVSILVMTAVRFARLVDSLILLDMSLVLLLILLPSEVSWETAIRLQYGRFVALLFIAVGTLLRQKISTDEDISLAGITENATSNNLGLGRRAPLALALFIFGAASLIGLPLTVGFPAHWAAIQGLGTAVTTSGNGNILLITLFAATGFCTLALCRAILYWFAPPD